MKRPWPIEAVEPKIKKKNYLIETNKFVKSFVY
jgi:hypothetical protein